VFQTNFVRFSRLPGAIMEWDGMPLQRRLAGEAKVLLVMIVLRGSRKRSTPFSPSYTPRTCPFPRVHQPHYAQHKTFSFRRAPCKGGAFQWVQAPPGELAPAGSNRSSHGGNEMTEAFG
jgi:hypothetical protein